MSECIVRDLAAIRGKLDQIKRIDEGVDSEGVTALLRERLVGQVIDLLQGLHAQGVLEQFGEAVALLVMAERRGVVPPAPPTTLPSKTV